MADSENVDKLTLQRLTVLELQQELKRRGLKRSGVKAKLIERLLDYMQVHGYQLPGADSGTAVVVPVNNTVPDITDIPENKNGDEPVLDQSHISVDDFLNPDYQGQDARDFAEEFTEPIHQIEPTSNLPNRVIEMDEPKNNTQEGLVDSDVSVIHHQPGHSEGEDKQEEVDNRNNQSEDDNEQTADQHDEQETVGLQENSLTTEDEKAPIDLHDSSDGEGAITDVLHTDNMEEALDYEDDDHHGEEKINVENEEQIEMDQTAPSDDKVVIEEEEDGEVIEESSNTAIEKNEYENGVTDIVAEQTKSKQKTVVPVALKKRVSLQASAESAEEKAARRKRRWGSTKMSDSITISTDSMKKLMPDVKIDASAMDNVPELDYQEDETVHDSIEEEKPSEEGASKNEKVTPSKKRRTVKVDTGKKVTIEKQQSSETVIALSHSAAASPPKPVVTRSIRPIEADDDTDELAKRDRSPSPARNKPSCYIHIDNLVRPYTVNQLKNLIGKTGVIKENQFWINNIKSHCYVAMSSVEEATATRQALHGISWPSGSPKTLRVDFAIVEKMWSETNGSVGEEPKVVIEIEDKENDVQVVEKTRRAEREIKKKSHDEERKKRQERSEKRSKDKNKEPSKKRDEREESPAKLLDDLFRKTKATPCIYWLPLTDAQISEREKESGDTKPATTRITERPRDINRRPDRRYSPVRRSPPRRMNDRGWR